MKLVSKTIAAALIVGASALPMQSASAFWMTPDGYGSFGPWNWSEYGMSNRAPGAAAVVMVAATAAATAVVTAVAGVEAPTAAPPTVVVLPMPSRSTVMALSTIRLPPRLRRKASNIG